MIAVGEYLILMRQIRAAAINKIDAGQMVRLGDLLRAQMFFDRHRIICAAFDGRIIGNNHALPPRYAAKSR